MDNCIFCGLTIIKKDSHDGIYHIECENCGKYKITYEAFEDLPNEKMLKKDKKGFLISGYLRELTDLGLETDIISNSNINTFFENPLIPKTVNEKINKVLLSTYRKTGYLNQSVVIDNRHIAIGYAQCEDELNGLLGALNSSGYIQLVTQFKPFKYILTYEGFQKAEALINEISIDKNSEFETTSERNLKELIDRSNIVKRNFKLTGGVGVPILNTISGSEFEEWLADIKVTVSQLKSDTLTENVLKLTDSFNGWSDEKNFEKLTAQLKAICKNYKNYFVTKDVFGEEDKMIRNKVFVVHGRNGKLRSSMFSFLRSIGVEPLEWNEVKKITKKASPYIGEVLDAAFTNAQAIIVLFTPDDEAKLRDEFINDDDPDYEKELTPQARPNVIFEAGMALGRMEDRTIIVQFGRLRQFSDIAGRHIIKFLDSPEKRYELVEHLKTAGVDVRIDGRTDWLSVGDFKI